MPDTGITYIRKGETVKIQNNNQTTITGQLEKIDSTYVYLMNAFFNEEKEITYDINLRKSDIKDVIFKSKRNINIELIKCHDGTVCVPDEEINFVHKFVLDLKEKIFAFFRRINDFFRHKKNS
ncbi:hypothetical protein GVAV_003190 [Gurleya vavrai]